MVSFLVPLFSLGDEGRSYVDIINILSEEVDLDPVLFKVCLNQINPQVHHYPGHYTSYSGTNTPPLWIGDIVNFGTDIYGWRS